MEGKFGVFKGFLYIQNHRKLLVNDLDLPDGFNGGELRLGDHRSNIIGVLADSGVEQLAITDILFGRDI
ncbi:MAG: hypothetical protein BWY50_01586 [Spirochaetes bacterium ADurb.Bin315]|nr:MAG: hypothetical protein BWY50_01586 [Spirochaetes bacterium ADurb.Bin315]